MGIKEYNHAITFAGKTNQNLLDDDEKLIPYKGASILTVQKRSFNDLYR